MKAMWVALGRMPRLTRCSKSDDVDALSNKSPNTHLILWEKYYQQNNKNNNNNNNNTTIIIIIIIIIIDSLGWIAKMHLPQHQQPRIVTSPSQDSACQPTKDDLTIDKPIDTNPANDSQLTPTSWTKSTKVKYWIVLMQFARADSTFQNKRVGIQSWIHSVGAADSRRQPLIVSEAKADVAISSRSRSPSQHQALMIVVVLKLWVVSFSSNWSNKTWQNKKKIQNLQNKQ
jgi:hypothetical protein